MKQILKDRQIEWLLHFTRADNLPNILNYGLLPRSTLIARGISSIFNNHYRYDECESAVCTSIEFPNYKMFFRLKQDNPDVDWVVILLDANIICDFDCAFCSTNAGSAEVYNTAIEDRKGPQAFLRLFEELPAGPSRKKLGIGKCYPTDPQAEVLVFDSIPQSYILEVFFNKQSVLEQYLNLFPGSIEAKVSKKAFSYRVDWEYW